MADYYPLLVRALASLPQKTAEHRKAVYDRARTALLKQLRGVDPPLPEGEIGRERQALEEAIRRSEADFPPEPAAEAPARPSAAAAPAAPPETVPAPVPTPVEPEANGEAVGSAYIASPVEGREPRRRAEAPRAGSGAPDRAAFTEDGEERSGPRRGEVRSRQAAAGARPAARNGHERKARGGSWQRWVLLTLVIAVVLGGAALVAINRASIFGGGAPRQAAAPTIPADQPKSADRVAPASGDAARRAPAPRAPAVSGIIRAQLLEESPDGSAPQTFEGTVAWKTESVNAGPGLPPDIGIRADILIPERQIATSFVLRRNTDQTLPASHTIEVGFKLPKDFAFGGVASIPYVAAKPNLQAQRGEPLIGLSVRVNPSLFLVGLSTEPKERQRNVLLMQAATAFDVPLVYTNNKRAKLAFEKGESGKQVFTDAFTAWGEYIPPPEPQPQNGG